jgi:hypothetical protein
LAELFIVSGAKGQLGGQLIAELNRRNSICREIHLNNIYSQNQKQLRIMCSNYQKITYIHCATKIWPNSKCDIRLNMDIPGEIFDILTKIGKEFLFIFVSSINAVIPSLRDKYSISKRHVESLLKEKDAIIIRPDLIWGKQSHSKHIQKIKKSIFSIFGKRILLFPGTGHTYLPAHPQDIACSILVFCQNYYKGNDINIVGNEPIHIFDLIRKSIYPKLIIFDISLGIGKYFPKKLKGLVLALRFLQQIVPLNRSTAIDLNLKSTRPLLEKKCLSNNSWLK